MGSFLARGGSPPLPPCPPWAVAMAAKDRLRMKARPGRITDQELEKEGGGSGLRYSFDIKAAGHVYEVGVDAVNGRVLENGAEGAHPD